MTVDEAIICLSDMKIKVAIPKAAVQARLNNDALDMAIAALELFGNSEQFPSAQPERKTGWWILVASGRGGYECSCCHEYAPSYRCGEDRLSNFCPNCGADMRGEWE